MLSLRRFAILGLLALSGLLAGPPVQDAAAQSAKVRVSGTVRDLQNGITLPGASVEVLGSNTVIQTDIDGRYTLDLAPGSYELKIVMAGYQERKVKVEVRASESPKVDIGLAMKAFSDEVTVEANTNAVSSSAEAQLSARKGASVITDNLGSDDMKANGDSDAASALARVTGLSIVDSQ